jgi:hypothetical protein
LQDLFQDTAEHLARESNFCQRARKLTGPVFAQALVFTLLSKPNATLDDYVDTAEEALDIPVTSQAFDQRFIPAAATFLESLFLDAFNRSFASLRPALWPLLRRFPAVFVRDGMSIALPDSLALHLPGRGGKPDAPKTQAAVKLVFEAEVTTGDFTDVSILAGRDNEKVAEVAGKPLPEGALLLEDMGFLSGERLQTYGEQGVYFLTRIPAWTAVFDVKGRRLDLVRLLRQHKWDNLELPVRILHGCQLQVRLLAVRLPAGEAQKRRERVRAEAKQHGRKVSQQKLDLCEWNILVTNAPAELIGVKEAWVMRRVRWQIELVFKVFKSEGKVDEMLSEKPARVMCELYAKLLGMVVQNWLLLSAGYQMLKHSARRAARRVRGKAMAVLEALASVERLARVVKRLATVLHRRCAITPRHREPSTLDRLNALDPMLDRLGKRAVG